MQVSPYTRQRIAPRQKLPEPNVFNISHLIEKMSELESQIESVKALKEQMRQEHEAKLQEVDDRLLDHTTTVQELVDTKLSEVDDTLTELKAVDFTGQPGVNADPVDEKAIEERVFSRIQIPDPIPGQDAFVDENALVKKILFKIPKAEPVKLKSVDHQVIVDKIFEILDSGKKKLSLKHIGDFTDGLEQTIRPMRSLMAGFRGGGDVVTAGSNITITTNSDGKKVITSTGGSGFTELSATETPDGIVTVFTFSSASAQPSYIVSDNVWMKATSKAGTVNWTWASGTKKATLTIPPVDDIYAIV